MSIKKTDFSPFKKVGTTISPKVAGDDITTTGTGTLGSTYQAILGDDSNTRAGYFVDGTNTVSLSSGYYSIQTDGGGVYVDASSSEDYGITIYSNSNYPSLYAYDNVGITAVSLNDPGGFVGLGFGAGNFKYGSNTVSLADDTYAINAASSSDIAGKFTDGTSTAYLGYYGVQAGNFTNGDYTVNLADTENNAAILAIGPLYLDNGSFTTDGFGNITAGSIYYLSSGIYDGGSQSIDTNNRYLMETDGSTVALDWGTSGQITIRAAIYSISTILNINSALYVDGPQQFVGINNALPAYPLDVNGNSYFGGDTTTTGEGTFNTSGTSVYVGNSSYAFTDQSSWYIDYNGYFQFNTALGGYFETGGNYGTGGLFATDGANYDAELAGTHGAGYFYDFNTSDRVDLCDGTYAINATGDINLTGNITTTGTNTAGYQIINQIADSQGWQINGYDDRSDKYLKGYIDSGGASELVSSSTFRLIAPTFLMRSNSASGKIYMDLGDAAGASKLIVRTDGFSEKIEMDSLGNIQADGDITIGGSGVFGGSESGQSIIDKGLVVNEGGTGADATSDFRAETTSNANAFVVDASADEVNIGVASTFGDGGTTNYTEIKTDGEIELHGDARVLKRLQINIGSVKGAGTNPATYVTYGLNGAFEFSKTITETIAHADAVPLDIDRSVAPQFTIGWSSPATTGTCVFYLEVLYRSEDEDWSSTTPDTTIEIEATPSTTANGLQLLTFNLPILSSTDAGIITRLSRLGGDGDDDMNDVAYVLGGAIDYVSNKLGDTT